MERSELEARLAGFFARREPSPSAVYLFGSRARDLARAGSDVDIAVLDGVPAAAGAFDGLGLDLAGEIEAAIGLPVDLVVLERAPVDLVHRVLRDGVLVHEGDRSRRIRFEVAARAEYFDLLPILERYRRLVPPGDAGR